MEAIKKALVEVAAAVVFRNSRMVPYDQDDAMFGLWSFEQRLKILTHPVLNRLPYAQRVIKTHLRVEQFRLSAPTWP